VLVSPNFFDEYAPVERRDRARYLATLDYLDQCVGADVIRPTNELFEAEVRVRRRLRFPECVFDKETRSELWEAARSSDMVADVVPQVEAAKRRYEAKTIRQRARAHEIYADRKLGEQVARGGRIPKLSELAHEWGKRELRGAIDEWTRDTLTHMARDGRIPPEAADLEPSQVPTLRNIAAYFMGRVARNVSNQARIRGSDSYDQHHYAAARYADLLVCDDSDFRQTVALIDESVRIATFDEFRGDLETVRCGPVADRGNDAWVLPAVVTEPSPG
jgi:hypothetical protein